MATVKPLFGTANQTLTITLASLATTSTNYTGRASTYVDNSTNLYLDALLSLTLKSGASGVSTTGTVLVYAYASADGGTTYTDGATGTDAAWTGTNPPNARLLTILNMVVVATTYHSGPISVASAFGGTLPQRWGIMVVNSSGGAFDTTAGNFSVFYQGVQQTVA